MHAQCSPCYVACARVKRFKCDEGIQKIGTSPQKRIECTRHHKSLHAALIIDEQYRRRSWLLVPRAAQKFASQMLPLHHVRQHAQASIRGGSIEACTRSREKLGKQHSRQDLIDLTMMRHSQKSSTRKQCRATGNSNTNAPLFAFRKLLLE